MSLLQVQIPGGVTAAKGFRAAGMYGGLRAAGRKPDLALVVCDTEAVSAGNSAFSSHHLAQTIIAPLCHFEPTKLVGSCWQLVTA